MADPGSFPYRWFWFLGAALFILGFLFALQGNFLASAACFFAGVGQIGLGFLERHRGAPPL